MHIYIYIDIIFFNLNKTIKQWNDMNFQHEKVHAIKYILYHSQWLLKDGHLYLQVIWFINAIAQTHVPFMDCLP